MSDTYTKIIEILSSSKRVLITTHVRPDGDALGSCAAMYLALKSKGIEAEVLLLSHLPRKYAFIFQETGIVFHDVEKGWPADFPWSRFDALLVLDTGTWQQLPGLKERVENWRVPKIVIDHHLTQEEWADARLVVTDAAAAGEIIMDLLSRWEAPMTRAIADALYLAIITDTGWFQFSNTHPRTLRQRPT